jgi:hypothetical protein
MMASAAMFTGCSDFLDKEPLSSATEAIAFQTPEQFMQAANALYNLENWKDYNGGDATSTAADATVMMDHSLDISDLTSSGGGTTKETDWRWDKPYGYIRGCNILLEKAETYSGDKTALNGSVGTALFLRAWQHFYLLQLFGGVPIADHVFDVTDPVLFGPRNSRYEVIHFITNDLREAIKLLPQEKNIAAADKGKVSVEAAKAFLARVLLYEATWEKYVPNIGYDLDGDGTSVGAGTVKPSGYPDITAMLTEAKKMASEVMTEADAGTFALWQECDSLSYYYLFNIDDNGGNLSNYLGKGKNTNKEFILSVKYDYDVKKLGLDLEHNIPCNYGANIGAYLGEMFLCRNGLPIYISTDGTTREKNPDFLGFEHFYDEFRNRDYRFIGCANLPDRKSWMSDLNYGVPNTTVGKPYPDPLYPESPYNPNDPAFSSKTTIYNPTIREVTRHGSYGSRKYMPEGANRANKTSSPDWPVIRLAEVYLIYAEATVELGNGQISNDDLNKSINKIRARAGVAALTNELIADKYDAGYWDHAQGKTIIKKMNMLDEIRRERTCELFGEGFRSNDLRRWGIAQINLKGQKLGRYVLGTEYETATANDPTHHDKPCLDKNMLQHGIYEVQGFDYGRSIAALAANLQFLPKDYLYPLPIGQIRLNEALTQNPGW